jgi:hypothetical protein
LHWMDRPLVAATVRGMLEPGGSCAHVHAITHRGVDGETALPDPRPPHRAIDDLVRRHLGPVRRAGRGHLPRGTATGEADVYRAAGLTGPERIEVPGRIVTRDTEDVVAAVFSLSSSTPHLFGAELLHRASPSGTFSEQTHDIAIDLWRP